MNFSTQPIRKDFTPAYLPWCAVTRGDYAWVFDNEEDLIVPRLARTPSSASHAIVGFDVTDFLDHEMSRTPVTLYLFHLVRHLLDGRRLVCWMDEFWRLLADPAFESFAKDGPKTWRKLNGVMALATQSASDVLTQRHQPHDHRADPDQGVLPEPDANRDDYCEGFGLTEREFRLIKEELEPGSRRFLVRQGHQSVVCELDLKGFDAELAVISGRRANVDLVNELIVRHGAEPAQWLPRFYERVVS